MVDRYDVVVVGARCAGSPLAAHLADGGMSVALVVAEGMISDALRATGAFGPPVTVPADAPVGDRLVAFTGRRP